jgi:hypothetical protein
MFNKVSYWPDHQWKGVDLRTANFYPLAEFKNLPNLMNEKFYELMYAIPNEVGFRLKMWFPLWTASITVDMTVENYWDTYDSGFEWSNGFGNGYTTRTQIDTLPSMYDDKRYTTPFLFALDFRFRDEVSIITWVFAEEKVAD